MTHDALSDVLRPIRLRGAVFARLSFGLEWEFEGAACRTSVRGSPERGSPERGTPERGSLERGSLERGTPERGSPERGTPERGTPERGTPERGATDRGPSDRAAERGSLERGAGEHLIGYYVIAKGSAWACVEGGRARHLQVGDVAIFPHGGPQMVGSASDGQPCGALTQSISSGEVRPDIASNELIYGALGCDGRSFKPLLDTLPQLLVLRADAGGSWTEQLMAQVGDGTTKPPAGQEAVLERISEIMLVDAVRQHFASLPTEGLGWLAGLRDRQLGKALALIHQSPAQAWTIDSLACHAGLSRSVFYTRFESLLSQSPKQYLTQCRIDVASGLLRSSHAPVASIALDVGYESEAAFARAFKRLTGTPPARWRKLNA